MENQIIIPSVEELESEQEKIAREAAEEIKKENLLAIAKVISDKKKELLEWETVFLWSTKAEEFIVTPKAKELLNKLSQTAYCEVLNTVGNEIKTILREKGYELVYCTEGMQLKIK